MTLCISFFLLETSSYQIPVFGLLDLENIHGGASGGGLSTLIFYQKLSHH